MKKILIAILFTYQFSLAQTSTEKWNSLYNRYETFDSNGNMISYKVWNSIHQRWETYTGSSQNTGYVPNKKRTDDNFELLKTTMESKQSKYNYNKQRILKYISDTRDLLNSSNLHSDLVNSIANRFNAEYLKPYYNNSYDLSYDSVTQNVINWLSNGFDKIVTEEGDKFKSKISNTKNLVGGYFVPLIEEQNFVNGKWITKKTETYNASLFFHDDMIWFKRGSNRWIARKLVLLLHDTSLKAYVYSSDHGTTLISDDYKYVLFYDRSNANVRYYYTIGDKSQSIVPKDE